MNVADNLKYTAKYFPDHGAVVEGDRRINYSEFNQDANRIASALVDFGVKPGDHIALCAPNSYAWLVFYFGTIRVGAVAVTFSHLLMKDEFLKTITDCKPRILFTIDEKLDELGDYGSQPFPELVICDHGDISFSRFLEKGTSSFKTVDRYRRDTAAILYTGGTTGTPKGALLSHENLQTSIFNVAYHERSTPNDRVLCFLPLNHVFGQIHIMNSTVFSGGSVVIQPAFDMDRVLDEIKRYQVTKFYSVPTIFIRLLKLPDLREKIKSVRYCFSAAASMAVEVVREWKKKAGLDIHEAYGMTESASMVTYNHYYKHVVGSVGTPANLVEVEIRDLEGNILGQGEQGEICICGPNITKGYLNNPKETEAAFWGDWFRSGDIGFIDDEGYLFIVDRLKDMIITGGENVYPKEIEEILYTCPEVSECVVVGIPDQEYGERVTAFITPNEGQEIDPVSMKKYLKTRLAGYKVPKEYIAFEELPKSSTGKILKREVIRLYTDSK